MKVIYQYPSGYSKRLDHDIYLVLSLLKYESAVLLVGEYVTTSARMRMVVWNCGVLLRRQPQPTC